MKDNSFPSRISLQRIPGRDALWKMAKTKSHIHQQKKTTPTFCPNDTDNHLKAKRATIAPRKTRVPLCTQSLSQRYVKKAKGQDASAIIPCFHRLNLSSPADRKKSQELETTAKRNDCCTCDESL